MKKYPILLIAWLLPSVIPNAANANLLDTLRSALNNQCVPTSGEYCDDFHRATPRGTQCICPCDYQFYDERVRACEDCPFATVEGQTTCGDTSCAAGSRLVAFDGQNISCGPGFVLGTIQQRTCNNIYGGPRECNPGFILIHT